MKSRIALIFLVILWCLGLTIAQKHDYVWCLGYESIGDSTTGFGGQNIYFHSGIPQVNYRERALDFNASSASICDKNGKLLFYTNGCKIFTADDVLMEGGDSLTRMDNYWTQEFWCPRGFNYTQGMIILPDPEDEDVYYLFHQDIKIYPDFFPYSDELLMTTISFKDNKKGSVVKRNELILNKNIDIGGMAAVKHANGKDWWIIINEHVGKTFHKLLLTKFGIIYSGQQSIGSVLPGISSHTEIIQGRSSKFDPMGSLFARFHILQGLDLFDFNRKTGEFSNARFTPFWKVDSIGSYFFGNGMEFSSDSKLMYLCYGQELVQFDLKANDIFASRLLIDTFVVDTAENIFQSRFYQLQLGPDGKIYMSHLNATQSLHVIHDPNKRGKDCDFKMRDLKLKTWNFFTMPYFPNFRLGPDTTTVATLETQEYEIILWPNPGTNMLEILVPDNTAEHIHVALVSLDGKIILKYTFNTNKNIQLDTKFLQSGIYIVNVRFKDGKTKVLKWVKL